MLTTATEACTADYKFTGKERDTESGLDNFGARYFGSTMGRFMSPDWSARPSTVPYANLADPQSLNLYSYVRNNPTSLYDPTGHWRVAQPLTLLASATLRGAPFLRGLCEGAGVANACAEAVLTPRLTSHPEQLGRHTDRLLGRAANRHGSELSTLLWRLGISRKWKY
jgi:RHS repeat-associated protein